MHRHKIIYTMEGVTVSESFESEKPLLLENWQGLTVIAIKSERIIIPTVNVILISSRKVVDSEKAAE